MLDRRRTGSASFGYDQHKGLPVTCPRRSFRATLLLLVVTTVLVWNSSGATSPRFEIQQSYMEVAKTTTRTRATTTTQRVAKSTSYLGILYDHPKFVEVVDGASWVGVILSDPLDEKVYRPFVEKMHSIGLVVAGTINRPTIDAVSAATLRACSFGFDMIIFDELLSLGVLNGNTFNKIRDGVKTQFPNVKIGMSDYDIRQLTAFMRVAKPDFIAITAYQDLATSKKKIDAIASLAAQANVPAYAWVNFADPQAPSTLDQTLLTELTNYARSKLNGVWFWEYGDATWSGWTYEDWYLKNYPHVKTLTATLAGASS